jgi:hypothetical protein
VILVFSRVARSLVAGTLRVKVVGRFRGARPRPARASSRRKVGYSFSACSAGGVRAGFIADQRHEELAEAPSRRLLPARCYRCAALIRRAIQYSLG